MRLLMVTQSYYPFVERGGPAFKVRSLARGLKRRGHTVSVLTADYGLNSSNLHPDPEIETHYLSSLARYRALTVNHTLLEFCRRRLREFDLVHIFGLYDVLGPITAAYCRRWRIPYVLEPLGMTRPRDRNIPLKRLWHLLFGKRLIESAALVIATSEQERQELPAAKVAVRHNGLDAEEFRHLPARGLFRARFGIELDEPLALFLGRLIPRKGAHLLITAFRQACPCSGRLVIAGAEDEPGYLRHLRTEAGDRVLFPGPLYGERKLSAMVDADVFVLPSRYENFGNAAAESIACGTPVIVGEGCGISELIGGRAGLVVPPEELAISGAIGMVLRNDRLREQLRLACPLVAASLSWDILLGLQEQLYHRAMAGEFEHADSPAESVLPS